MSESIHIMPIHVHQKGEVASRNKNGSSFDSPKERPRAHLVSSLTKWRSCVSKTQCGLTRFLVMSSSLLATSDLLLFRFSVRRLSIRFPFAFAPGHMSISCGGPCKFRATVWTNGLHGAPTLLPLVSKKITERRELSTVATMIPALRLRS